MKKILPLFLVLLLASCQKDEPKLSCTKEIDDWAKETVETMNQFDRGEIVSLPLSRQRAIYRGLSADAKCALWQAKLSLVREDKSLSTIEVAKLEDLYRHLSPNLYQDENIRESFIVYAEKWRDRMIKDHGWNDDKIFFYVCTWMSHTEFQESVLLDKISEEIMSKGPIIPGTDQKKDCNCHYSYYCVSSGLGSTCDSGYPCNLAPGCGILGTSSCDGFCS